MRISCIGGGPASLYFALLMKKAYPDADITVHERNKADDTFGWGVVFSDETLGHFEAADPETYAEIRRLFRYWGDIDTYVGGALVRSTGHGFCGMSRKRLLQVFHDRCLSLGVTLRFQDDVPSVEAAGPANLVVAADGVHSAIRTARAAAFRPTIGWGACRFTWLGTTKPLTAFTFVFRENEHGLFVVHAYPFEAGLSTWIVECAEATWLAAGLDRASEDDTVAYVRRLFADHLDGHQVLTNKSIWRRFPMISCASWRDGNVVLMGDAAHTAHFSIGSGTKLAMEDAIALAEAFRVLGTGDVPRALAAYEAARRVDVLKVQRAALTSQAWFEHATRWKAQDPVQFTFNLMSRSKRITYDNLAKRDPTLVARVRAGFASRSGMVATPGGGAPGGEPPPPCLVPYQVRGLTLANRIVVSPMCQYSAVDGAPTDWHLVHLGSRAVGGAGLVIAEMTDVSPEGRITVGCAGMYDERHVAAWRRITEFVHAHSGAKVGVQLAHAGRKASCELPWAGGKALRDARAWATVGPSAVPFYPGDPAPRAMDRAAMDKVVADFAAATDRAQRAGFDLVELHMAHGYLLSSFLSPLSNRRTDAYGGSLENRLRFPLEVLGAVRATWPADRPVFVRISASDWMPDGSGTTEAESVDVAKALAAHGCDVVDVSSAGNVPESRPVYGRMYQVPFADRIRNEGGVPVMAVGGIQGADHANTVIAAGRADLCALARPHLTDPYLTLHAIAEYDVTSAPWPPQYLAVRPPPRSRGPGTRED